MTRRPVKVVHSRANSAMVWLLPAPAGATSTVVAAVAVSIMTTASRCSAFSPVRSTAARACSLADQLRHGPFRGREDLLLDVEVGQGAVPFLVRRPVDAAAVGGAHAEAGHVGGVGGGDLDDVGAGPAADGQPGDLVDHRRAVDARLEDGERPVHLEPELGHRPHRVQLLHLGHRDPRGPALGRVIQRGACAPGALAGGERRDLLVHRRQRLHFAACGLRFPRGEPLRLGGFGRAGLPGDGAAGLRLWCGGCSARPAGAAATASAATAACRAPPGTRGRAGPARR